MMEENTNWEQSVTGIVICQGKVLLARHTYGTGKGKLIVPGGGLCEDWRNTAGRTETRVS